MDGFELIWGNPALDSTGFILGAMVTTSMRAHAYRYIGNCCCQCPCPLRGLCQPCLCKGCPSTSRQVWFHLLWGHCSYPLGAGTQDFVSVLQEWNVSPALWKSALKSCWPLKSDSLGIPNPFARSPGWESDLGLSTFTTVGEPLWHNCPPVCGPPTRRLWNWILLWLRTSYSLVAAFSLDVGYLFRWVPALLVDECWVVSGDFGALTGGGEHTPFSSAGLNQSPAAWLLMTFLPVWFCWAHLDNPR